VRLRYDDEDLDGELDARDNCRGLKNNDQRDTDRDRQGNACDTDDDNDGVPDADDRCPVTRRGADANGDGCGDPRSRIKYPSSDRARFRSRRAPRKISGIASADVLGVDHVEVALAHVSGGSCRWYGADGAFGPSTSCDNPVYLRANGARRWSLAVRVSGRGAYRALSRAVQRNSGLGEDARNSRNTRSFRLR